MSLLLDTNVLIWALSDPDKLSAEARTRIEDESEIVYFSQVSLLEIQIKCGIGKLSLDRDTDDLPKIAQQSGFAPLALANEAIFLLGKLPDIHRDPFDRLLICESINTSSPLVTPDATIKKYAVKTIW